MRVPDASLDQVREDGFALVEGFLAPDEFQNARQALWLHFPTPDEYFADPARHSEYAGDQFAGVEEFPYRSWDLNRLAIHPDLVEAAERYLGTTDLHLYKIELWAKYAGAVDYDQPLHRDYGSHSLVVPRRDHAYQQLTTFIFLSDVDEEDGPTRIVPYPTRQECAIHTALHRVRRPCRSSRYLPLGPQEPCSSTAPISCTAVPTSPAPNHLDFRSWPTSRPGEPPGAGRWRGRSNRPIVGPNRPRCTVRERDLFGFPRPGHDYWNEQTLADTALRYPGLDLEPYREPVG